MLRRRARARNDKLVGSVSVYFEIDPDGRVFRSQVNGTSLPDPEAQTCVAAAFRALRFAPPPDGSLIVESYPIRFARDE